MIFNPGGFCASSGPVHVRVHDARLSVEDAHVRMLEGERVPKAEDTHLGDSVGGEASADVEVGDAGTDFDHNGIFGGMTCEGLSNVQIASDVQLKVGE